MSRTPGMRESERCVSVRDIHGHREWLLVEHSFLAERRKKIYLPIGVVEFDRVCTVRCHPSYIACLADQAERVLGAALDAVRVTA